MRRRRHLAAPSLVTTAVAIASTVLSTFYRACEYFPNFRRRRSRSRSRSRSPPPLQPNRSDAKLGKNVGHSPVLSTL